MDGLGFHPYPNQATDPIDRGYGWPNAGFANLDRIKQAFWDAFGGTAQPTTVEGLQLYLDEVGWQVDTSSLPGYTGTENVSVTDEKTQASIYAALVQAANCDRSIAEVNIFGFYDDGPRDAGFQSALNHVDGTPRARLLAVQNAIAQSGGGCTGRPTSWSPARKVVGAVTPTWSVAARRDDPASRRPLTRAPTSSPACCPGTLRRDGRGDGDGREDRREPGLQRGAKAIPGASRRRSRCGGWGAAAGHRRR